MELLDLDSRIDPRCDQVSQQITQHNCCGRNNRDSHNDWDVNSLNGLPGKLSYTWPTKHTLHNNNPRHEQADVNTNHGNDWQDCIGNYMSHNDLALGNSLCSGRSDKVLMQDINHGRAHHARVPPS